MVILLLKMRTKVLKKWEKKTGALKKELVDYYLGCVSVIISANNDNIISGFHISVKGNFPVRNMLRNKFKICVVNFYNEYFLFVPHNTNFAACFNWVWIDFVFSFVIILNRNNRGITELSVKVNLF